jgi:hypothetical protein
MLDKMQVGALRRPVLELICLPIADNTARQRSATAGSVLNVSDKNWKSKGKIVDDG